VDGEFWVTAGQAGDDRSLQVRGTCTGADARRTPEHDFPAETMRGIKKAEPSEKAVHSQMIGILLVCVAQASLMIFGIISAAHPQANTAGAYRLIVLIL